jgi:uncharacterized protein YndB with AHSA1/START domain
MDVGHMMIVAQGDREIAITRFFDAKSQLVYDAMTKPELMKRWLFGPDGWELAVCEVDLRPGGVFRYVWRHTERGTDMGMGGIFTEIEAPAKIVHKEVFDEDWTGGETVVTTWLTELGGRTKLEMTIRYASSEARDGALKSGMAEGMEAGYARLDEIFRQA